tara:strand:+ start:861 stop:1340 length:480 start_codon:yes stop_codon:yes gene_type:complete
MAYENKPRIISDEDKERPKEEQTSLARQRDRRTLNQQKKELKEQRDQELSRATSRQDRSEIKAKADAALEQANANFNETYYPSRNKQDYESDVQQRGIDQFNAPEATPESSGGGGGDVAFNGSVLICIDGSPYYIDIPYDSDTGPYAPSAGANFPISAP